MIDIYIGTQAKDDGIPWETFNAVGPHVLWFVFAVGLVWWIGRSRLDAMLARVQRLSVVGVEVEFKQTLQQAADARGKDVPTVVVDRAARRLVQSTALIAGARLLWIDDEPNNNRLERGLLEEAGAIVQEAVSSEEAWRRLHNSTYDVILSDIRRADDVRAGINFLKTLVDAGSKTPMIFYVGQASDAIPEGAFGITDSPDELVHLVLDALARCRS